MARIAPLHLQRLEDRIAPATYGIPWRDPEHLTVSFAPDGTQIAGHESSLFQTLDAYQAPADWQREILQALQTWAVNANIDLSVQTDDAEPFGTAGDLQGDPRFGDIRIGAQAMSSNVLAVTVPFDPLLSGTWGGKVFLNSQVQFDADRLFPVALHEAGHALGLDDSDDPNSVMYEQYNPLHTALSPDDIASLQALYGARSPARYHGTRGGTSFAAATEIHHPGGYNGATPLTVFGDQTTPQDVQYYSVRTLAGYRGPVTFRLQTAGVSLLAPRLTIYGAAGNALGLAESTSFVGDVLTVTLPGVGPNSLYYIKVESAAADVFGVGRYDLAITFDERLTTAPAVIDAFFRGPYAKLSEEGIQEFFRHPDHPLFGRDEAPHGRPDTAVVLAPTTQLSTDWYYETINSLNSPAAVDFYRVQAPVFQPGIPNVLTVTLWQVEPDGVVPWVSVYDANQVPVGGAVLINGNGTFAFQVPQVESGARYYLGVAASPFATDQVGNYDLLVHFGQVQADLPTLVTGSLDNDNPQRNGTLYIARSQLFHLVLSAQTLGDPTDASVCLTIYRDGVPVQSLEAHAGETVSADTFLIPGTYTASLAAASPSGSLLTPLQYDLRGAQLSDPIGPALDDPTLNPIFLSPSDPWVYLYPGDITSRNPFLFVW
jgi:hypothetical protein